MISNRFRLAVCSVLLVICSSGFSQNTNYTPHINSITSTVKGINENNYKLVKKQWGFLGRAIIPKKKLFQAFNPLVEKYGPLSIDTIVFKSRYTATAELHTPSSKRLFLHFNFTDKGKLEGLGMGYPVFVYKKSLKSLAKVDLPAKIDSIVQSRIAKSEPRKFNGSVLITQGDSILYKKSAGKLNYYSNEVLNDSSAFLLASCSKQFTAVAIMKLAEDKLLDIDQKVKKYLPEFPYENITVRHLLTHTSGLPDYFTLLKKYRDSKQYATNADVLKIFARQHPKLTFEPNEYFEYSNTGYLFLSLIIESVSEQSYAAYLKKNIFEPLKMHHTHVYHRRIEGDTLKNYAVGNTYSRSQKKYILPDSSEKHQYVLYMDGLTGDDGVSSSILDLKKWNESFKNNVIVSRSTANLGRKSHTLNNGNETGYGFGIFVKSGEAIQNIEYHTGGWPGYTTMIVRLTELDKSIIVLSNNEYDNFDSMVDEIAFLLCKYD